MADNICARCGCNLSLTTSGKCPVCPPVEVILDEDDWNDLKKIFHSLTWGQSTMNTWHALVKRVDSRIEDKKVELGQLENGK